jgi:hypothetical protein
MEHVAAQKFLRMVTIELVLIDFPTENKIF